MKQLIKFFLLIIFVGIVFSSCNKEELVEVKASSESEQVSNHEFEVAQIDGKKYEWNLEMPARKNTLSKGIMFDDTSIETKQAVYLPDNSYSYTAIRVDRKSQPGKYFYVMIDNLDIPIDTACWAYNNDESNVAIHGRLYTYYAANALARSIYMYLPATLKGKSLGEMPCRAKLPNMTDICDIIQSESIGNFSNGYDLDTEFDNYLDNLYNGNIIHCYYDAFVGGLELYKSDMTKGYKSLGGYYTNDNNIYSYDRINELGLFWTDIISTSDTHYPLEIEYMYHGEYVSSYAAFVNAGFSNRYGFSVRYVFEPIDL